MSHPIAVSGLATPTGLYARCADGWRKLQPTRTPIVALVPCRHCGKYFGCDCLDWFEWMLLAEPQEDSSND